MIKHSTEQSGFALLLTLVIVSVVVAIGISLLEITLKQLTLSGTARDSEIAFHASYAGAECAQYHRVNNLAGFLDEDGDTNPPSLITCLPNAVDYQESYTEVASNVHFSDYEMTWGSVDDRRCSEIDIYVYDASAESSAVQYDIQFYGTGTEECPVGQVCTVVLARGYNRACGDGLRSLRTIQREIVLEF